MINCQYLIFYETTFHETNPLKAKLNTIIKKTKITASSLFNMSIFITPIFRKNMAIQRFDVQPVFAVHFLGTVARQFDNVCGRICTLSRASIHRYAFVI